jgi:hypothetical protein
MKIDQLRDAMHAAPFQPFVIHVADGEAARVPDPDFIALLGQRTAIVTSAQPNVRPSYRLIDIPMITQLEIEGAPRTNSE